MFNKIKLFVLKQLYNYHHRKADEYFEKVNEGYVSENHSKWWEEYLRHAKLELLYVDEIYQIEGI